MTLLGGTSTIFGPILAAFILTIVTEQLAGLGVVRFMIVAVLIVLTLRFLPGGIWSLGETLLDRRRARAGSTLPPPSRISSS
jgi:ABC-type branched-subunit amino acid transport system permease subunit